MKRSGLRGVSFSRKRSCGSDRAPGYTPAYATMSPAPKVRVSGLYQQKVMGSHRASDRDFRVATTWGASGTARFSFDDTVH